MSIDPISIVNLLNEALKLDRKAISELFLSSEKKVVVNAELSRHPTIQVNSASELGILGILNGLIPPNALIGAEYFDDTIMDFVIIYV